MHQKLLAAVPPTHSPKGYEIIALCILLILLYIPCKQTKINKPLATFSETISAKLRGGGRLSAKMAAWKFDLGSDACDDGGIPLLEKTYFPK